MTVTDWATWTLPDPPAAWPDVLPDHLSASSATQYHRCREQWRIRNLDGKKDPPKGYLVWGSADSAAAAHNFVQKIDSHEDLPVKEVEEVFASAVDSEVDAWGGESQIQWLKDGSSAAVKDAGVKLAALYHKQAAPLVQPVAAEGRIEFRVPNVPVPIIGYVDVETADTVIERKTAGAKFRGGVPDGNYLAQARVYQLALAKPLHFHVSTKTKLPAVYTPANEPGLALAYLERDALRTQRWLATTAAAIVADLERFGAQGPWPGSEALRDSPCSWCGWGPNGNQACEWHR